LKGKKASQGKHSLQPSTCQDRLELFPGNPNLIRTPVSVSPAYSLANPFLDYVAKLLGPEDQFISFNNELELLAQDSRRLAVEVVFSA